MKVEKRTLLGQFEAILDRVDDPALRILVMTYEFDDQQLLNMLLQRPLAERLEPTPAHLANLADLAPVVIYDACKTKTGGLLPHFLELLPVKAKAWSCHHPKAYLVITSKQVHLLIGSSNLTASGLFANREAFLAFQWNGDQRQDLAVLSEFARLLQDEYKRSFDSPALDAILASLQERLSEWGNVEGGDVASNASLISSGFEARPSGLDQFLLLHANGTTANSSPKSLWIVSPFFDKGTNGARLIDEIEERLGPITRKELVTSDEGLLTIAKNHLGTSGVRRVWTMPPEIDANEKEQVRAANESAQVDDLKIERALHAKLLILADKQRALVYLGSANFSRNAWLGRNQELGVAWWHEGDPEALWQSLRAGLGCRPEDRFRELPESSPARPDATDPEDLPKPDHYPDFIRRAELEQAEDGRFRFRFEFDQHGLTAISAYEIDWAQLPLQVTDCRSQPFTEEETRARLFSGRHLQFVWKASPGCSYWIPFRHDASLFDARFEFVHPTPEDWMAHCLGRSRVAGDGDTGNDLETLPDDPPPAPNPAIGREDNPVIRMQRYLSDFALVEATFLLRAEQTTAERWKDVIETPLRTFARILERSTQQRPTDLTFQLGELALLASRLKGPTAVKQALVQAILNAMPATDSSSADQGLTAYRRFCAGGGS